MGEQLLDQNAVNAMARAAGFGEPRVGPPPASIGGRGRGSGSSSPTKGDRRTDFFSSSLLGALRRARRSDPCSLRSSASAAPLVAAARRGTFASITPGAWRVLRVVLQEVRREELHRVVRSLLHQRLHPLQEDRHHRGLGTGGWGGPARRSCSASRAPPSPPRPPPRVVVPGPRPRARVRARAPREEPRLFERAGRLETASERGEAGAEGPPRVAGANRGERAPSAGASSAIVTRVRSVASRRVGEWPERSGSALTLTRTSPEAGRARCSNRVDIISRRRAPLRTRVRSSKRRGLRSSLAGAVGTGLGALKSRPCPRAAIRRSRRRTGSRAGVAPPLGRRTPVGRRGARGGADAPRGLGRYLGPSSGSPHRVRPRVTRRRSTPTPPRTSTASRGGSRTSPRRERTSGGDSPRARRRIGEDDDLRPSRPTRSRSTRRPPLAVARRALPMRTAATLLFLLPLRPLPLLLLLLLLGAQRAEPRNPSPPR